MTQKSTFILAGNGPYENRGCEAIVRGTIKILRYHYRDPNFLCLSFYKNKEQFEKQCNEEYDPEIIHKKASKRQSIFDVNWILRSSLKGVYSKPYKDWIYKEMIPYIENSNAVLSIGGDNYSLDYGIPSLFTDLDDVVLKRRRPIIIWGASVGPFDTMPEYEKYIKKHLQSVSGIFARESATIEYLQKIGVRDNVYKVADPAFLMDACEPQSEKKIEIENDSIGINLSPLMAKYTSNGNIELWINTATQIIKEISRTIDNKIYLIPHVTIPKANDYLFLKEIKSRIKDSEEKVILIPPIYNASETKWIISKMKLFAGARTHSTIASLSSNVPTLSFAYSIKAKGINQDIFGHDDYCLNPERLRPKTVAEKLNEMLEINTEIRSCLKVSIPKIEKNALLSGEYLQKIT
ncbi:polysaccharide pyruvyl transferase [Methanosarcina mazei]|uniref:Polysaccharide pyruvyl transferase n=1 Tax=Methanosarcina mazei TaxID=2209 RepID=A0A0F8HEA0_METMZ|nr:polysaccharide pyruvyl transferase family protein [Methanosarcina mazei]KKG76012.1 polysaccharide pyruvyl transferase [Methanosarcina mazei]